MTKTPSEPEAPAMQLGHGSAQPPTIAIQRPDTPAPVEPRHRAAAIDHFWADESEPWTSVVMEMEKAPLPKRDDMTSAQVAASFAIGMAQGEQEGRRTTLRAVADALAFDSEELSVQAITDFHRGMMKSRLDAAMYRQEGRREGERRAAQRFARAIPKVIGTPWATMLMDLVFAIEDGYVLPWEAGEVLKVPIEPEVDGD